MKYLISLLLLMIFHINSVQANPITPADLAGHWQGNISMVDHHHPLTFKLALNDDNGFTMQYEFWDMTFVDSDSQVTPDAHFRQWAEKFEIVLSDSGIEIQGTVSSSSQMQGTVQWMGRSQSIVFHKVDNSRVSNLVGDKQNSGNEMMNVAVLVFDGVDALDWAGPLEVFDYAHAFNTYTVAATMKPFDGGAYRVLPNYTFDNMPKADIVIVPGGSISQLFLHEPTIEWLLQASGSAVHVMSVCNASTLLAANGLLNGLKATTHGAWHKWLIQQGQELGFDVVNEGRFVDNGKIITTAGVSSGIDGALHLVAKLKGLRHARMTAQMMEYNWQPEAEYQQE